VVCSRSQSRTLRTATLASSNGAGPTTERREASNGAAAEVAAAGGVRGARAGPIRLPAHHLHRLFLLRARPPRYVAPPLSLQFPYSGDGALCNLSPSSSWREHRTRKNTGFCYRSEQKRLSFYFYSCAFNCAAILLDKFFMLCSAKKLAFWLQWIQPPMQVCLVSLCVHLFMKVNVTENTMFR